MTEYEVYLEKYSKKHGILVEEAMGHQTCKDAQEYFDSKPKKKEGNNETINHISCDGPR